MTETFFDLVKRSRTVRRYQEDKQIPKQVLIDIIDAARLTPSAGNRQPTRFIIVQNKSMNDELFKNLGWLGYMTPDKWPVKGERPNAYIILLYDNGIRNASFQYDAGIVAQTIVLGANTYNVSCCIIGAVNHTKVKELFNIPDNLDIISVISMGYPIEIVQLEDSKDTSDVMYWRDDNGIHHVPKLTLEQVIVGSFYEQ